jgi:hypothetical protein
MLGYLTVIVLSAGFAYASSLLRPAVIGDAEPQVGVAEYQTQDCPDAAAYVRAASWSFPVPPVQTDTIWQHVREALREWRKTDFPTATSEVVLLMENAAPQQMQERGVRLEQARTCYVVGRLPDTRIELRVAFWFSFRLPAEPEEISTLEIRWVGDIRGTGERRWQPDVKYPGVLAQDLIEHIEQMAS